MRAKARTRVRVRVRGRVRVRVRVRMRVRVREGPPKGPVGQGNGDLDQLWWYIGGGTKPEGYKATYMYTCTNIAEPSTQHAPTLVQISVQIISDILIIYRMAAESTNG